MPATVVDVAFWRTHLWLPLLLFVAAIAAIMMLGLDFRVADAWFDAATGVFPARDAWIPRVILHDGGNRLIRAIAFIAFGIFLLGYGVSRLRPLQRPSLYLALCIALTAGSVAIGKQVTNMDCPWSLDRYSGDRPYVSLFHDRPAALPRGHCFPGAHSSGAFALFAFYFIWRRNRPQRARIALVCAGVLGTIYAATQWARGAHFLSHDIWAALLAWLVCLGNYLLFNRRLWPDERTGDAAQGPVAPAGA